MRFIRWDPLSGLVALHEQVGQLVGSNAPGWTPPVDLYEAAAEYVLTAEVPGLSRDSLEIQAEDNRITICGDRAAGPDGAAYEQFHRVERGHGHFSRAFALPDPIDVEKVTADLRDGLLTVRIPKANDRATRRIAVT